MAQKLLSLDIREDIVCGVMLSAKTGAVTVVNCALSVPGEDKTIRSSIAEVLDHVGYNGEPCRVALDASNFFYRNLSFPFHDKRKIDKILPIELEDTVIVDMDEVLVDALVTGKRGDSSTVVAAMVPREFFHRHLEDLAELKLDPEIVTIANVQTALQISKNQGNTKFILLDAGCHRATMFFMVDGRMRLIRTVVFEDGGGANFNIDKNSQQVFARRPEKVEETFRAICLEVRHTLYALADLEPGVPVFLTGALADIPDSKGFISKYLDCAVHPCNLIHPPVQLSPECGTWRADLMTSALALGIRSGRKQIGFNFRKDEYGRKMSFERYRRLVPRLGVPLILCIILGSAYIWNDYSIRQNKLKSLEEQGKTVFRETLPKVSRVVDPVGQLKVEIREMKKGMLGEATLESDLKILDLMAEISVRIPTSINVHIVRMVADRNSVLLRGLTDTFNNVDSLKRVLENSGYFNSVTINSANLATKSSDIRFELKLELNRG